MSPVPNVIPCPGLVKTSDGLIWTDSLSRSYPLAKAARLSIAEVAFRLKRDKRTIQRRIAEIKIYPVIRFSSHDIEVYEVAIEDYLTRSTLGYKKEAAT